LCATRGGADKTGSKLWHATALPERRTCFQCDAVGITQPLFIILFSLLFFFALFHSNT
jgi:hypothetical protein